MYSKSTTRLFLLLLLITFSINSFSQNTEKIYNHQTALIKLENTYKKVRNRLLYNLDYELVKYIYENRQTFPNIPVDSSIEKKMQSLIPSYTQLNLILKSDMIKTRDSISKKQAMILATLGYQSIKLVSLGNEFMNSLDKNDSKYEVREKGYNQGIKGIQDFLLGYITITFLENQNIAVDDILISSLVNFTPKIINEFPQNKKENTISLIKKSIDGEKNIRLKSEFDNFIKSL